MRQGQVLIALSETGGAFVHEYAVSILKEGLPETEAVTWTVPQKNIISDVDGDKDNQVVATLPELPLPFADMPAAESNQKHHLRCRMPVRSCKRWCPLAAAWDTSPLHGCSGVTWRVPKVPWSKSMRCPA